MNWFPGEPNACSDNTAGGFTAGGCASGEDYVEIDLRGRNGRLGQWNDQTLGGDGNLGKYPLCESIDWVATHEFTYIGCYTDSADRDLDGLGSSG